MMFNAGTGFPLAGTLAHLASTTATVGGCTAQLPPFQCVAGGDVLDATVSAPLIKTYDPLNCILTVSGNAPITTYKNTRYVVQHGYIDPSKAIEELGLPQTPIETAITDSVKWFRENGYV